VRQARGLELLGDPEDQPVIGTADVAAVRGYELGFPRDLREAAQLRNLRVALQLDERLGGRRRRASETE
jgi:hypothetical protein